MKKAAILLLLIFLVACNNEETQDKITFTSDYYRVQSPFLQSVGENYLTNNDLNNYQPNIVESDLMMVATNYFKNNNSFFQNGQYLTKELLEVLLSQEKLNRSPEMIVNEQAYPTTFITAIHEHNYLAANGNLKGIALAIVVNPYQSYRNELGVVLYQEEQIEAQFLQKAADELIKILRDNVEIEDQRIMVTVFFQNAPNAMFPGTIKYFGETFTNEISLEEFNYQYHLLSSKYILDNDLETYNFFKNLLTEIETIKNDSRVVGKAVYFNHKVKRINIEINATNFHKGELLYLTNLLADKIKEKNYYIEIRIISANELEALVLKKEGNIPPQIIILRS